MTGLITMADLTNEDIVEVLDAAERLYQDALAISPRKLEPQEGLARIASRRRAERQLSIRYGDEPR